MPRSAWIHFGLHKTGSSGLQNALRLNRQQLAAEGICYPDFEGHRYDGQHELACALSDPDQDSGHHFRPEREAFCRKFRRRQGADLFAMPDCYNACALLLSSEIFSTYSRAELAGLRTRAGPGDLQAHLYFRSAKYLRSVWATKVRWGYRDDFARFFQDALDMRPNTTVLQTFAFVENLVEVFGAGNIRCRSYDAAIAGYQSVVSDYFQNVLGLNAPADADTLLLNESSSPELVELNRGINICAAQAGLPPKRRYFAPLCGRLEAEAGAGPFSKAHAQVAEALRGVEIAGAQLQEVLGPTHGFPRAQEVLEGWEPFGPDTCQMVPTPRLVEIVKSSCGGALAELAG